MRTSHRADIGGTPTIIRVPIWVVPLLAPVVESI